MKCYQINSFEEYLNLLEVLQEGKRLWFRGQSVAKYRLIPGVLRDAVAVTDWAGRDIKPQKVNFSGGKGESVRYINCWSMLQEYKNEIRHVLDFEPKNDLSWLALAQHYGLPTPLLDWSTDPLVALFFAISSVDLALINESKEEINDEEDYGYEHDELEDFRLEFKSDCAAVFVIDPIEINEAIPLRKWSSRILDIYEDDELIDNLMDSEVVYPFCIHGEKNDKRMCRQSGNFTAHSRLTYPMDYIEVYRKSMKKIIIPYSIIARLKRTLQSIDLSYDSVYMGKDVKDEKARAISSSFITEFKNHFSEAFLECE